MLMVISQEHAGMQQPGTRVCKGRSYEGYRAAPHLSIEVISRCGDNKCNVHAGKYQLLPIQLLKYSTAPLQGM